MFPRRATLSWGDITQSNLARTWRGNEGMPSPLGVSWVAEENANHFALILVWADDLRLDRRRTVIER